MENNANQLVKTEQLETAKLSEYLDVMGLAAKLTPKEKTQFIEIAGAFGLNPFKREIYCAKYGEQLSIIVGYETYIKRAERSGMLDGWQVVTEGNVKDESLKAIITIYRKDRKFPFVHEVFYSEYVQKAQGGQPNKFWQKAQTMTKKVAIAQGFRLCFSDELGGMPYTSEEINDTEYELIPNEPKQPEGKPIPLEPEKPTAPVVPIITEEQQKELNVIKENFFIKKAETDWIDKYYTTASQKNASDFIEKIKPLLADREAEEIEKNS